MMRQSWLRVWFGFRALENCSHSLDKRLIFGQVEKHGLQRQKRKRSSESDQKEPSAGRNVRRHAEKKLEGED